jgi:hypothetical protein
MFKGLLSKKEQEEGTRRQLGWFKVYGVSMKVFEDSEDWEQFQAIYDHIEKKLGVRPSKTAILKHCIALAYQFYNQEIGVGSF